MGTVLYVDDEDLNLTLFRLNFKNAYNIHTAKSAMEGYTILQSNPVDVLVTDYKMPEMNGMEFLEKLKNDNILIPSIMLSAYVDSYIVQSKRDMVTYFVSKPWQKEDLQEVIEKAIKQGLQQHQD